MEILEFCIKTLQNAKVDKFELYFEKSSHLSIEVKDGKLDHLSRATDQGLAIRILKDQHPGFSYTFDLSRNALEQAIRTAVELAELMPADPHHKLQTAALKTGDRAIKSLQAASLDLEGIRAPLERKIEMARSVESIALRQDPRIKRVRKAGYDESHSQSWLVASGSENEPLQFEQTVFGTELTCVAEEGSDAEVGGEGQYTCHLERLPYADVAKTAAHNALELLHAGQSPTMICPAVLQNSVVAQLVGFLASSFSAENIDKQSSFLVGKKGETLFSPKLHLLDDGLLEGGTATSPFDGEGTASQSTQLVKAGRIEQFLYNSYYADKHGVASTGNGRRGSLKAPPSVGPTNLYIPKGAKSPEAIFGGIDKGVYIVDVMGLHTANPVTGDFSVGASGILIENGKLTRPVKGFAIAGNLVELLRDIAEVGSDLKFWGSVGAPSVLVSKLSIGGA